MTTTTPKTDAEKTDTDWEAELAAAYKVDLSLPDTTPTAVAFRATLQMQARALVDLYQTKARALAQLQDRLQQAGGMTRIYRPSEFDHHDDLVLRIQERNSTLSMLAKLLNTERAH